MRELDIPFAPPEPFRIVCTGSRYWNDARAVRRVLRQVKDVMDRQGREVILAHGAGPGGKRVSDGHPCEGLDAIAGRIGQEFGWEVVTFPADWRGLGTRAGPIRNLKMLNEHKPHLVLAWHESRTLGKGTSQCVDAARRLGIPAYITVLAPAAATPEDQITLFDIMGAGLAPEPLRPHFAGQLFLRGDVYDYQGDVIPGLDGVRGRVTLLMARWGGSYLYQMLGPAGHRAATWHRPLHPEHLAEAARVQAEVVPMTLVRRQLPLLPTKPDG